MDSGFDVELGQRVIAGDDEAFARFYDGTVRGVHDFVVRMVRNRAAAEDLTQTVYIRAFEKRATVRDPQRLRAWLYEIARNVALNHVTRERATEDVDELQLADAERGPEAQAVSNELAELVWSAAASLEPRQYAVLDLSVRRGLTSAEIADVLGVDAAHGAVLVNRAREALANGVRYLLVARRRKRCERLDRLVPSKVSELTREQRLSVDHHMRQCDVCQDTAILLTAPAELFGGLSAVAVPASLTGRTFLAEISGQTVIPPHSVGLNGERTEPALAEDHGGEMNTIPTQQPSSGLGTPPLPPLPPPTPVLAPVAASTAAKASFLKVAIAVVVVVAAVATAIVLVVNRGGDTPQPKATAEAPGFDYLVAKADDLGNDQDAIISYVRDDVQPETYDGALRGAVATLWAGGGNDLDRALLLRGLLDAAGEKSRLVHGTTYGIEVRGDDGKYTYAGPAAESDSTAKPIDDVPVAESHTLEIVLRTTDAKGNDADESLGSYNTADLATTDLTVDFRAQGDAVVAALSWNGHTTVTHTDASRASRQVLVLSITAPDGTTIERRRALFDDRFADGASPFDPSSRYAIVVTTGWIPDDVRTHETEREAAALDDRASAAGIDAVGHVVAYTFLASSDANTIALARQQNVTAHVTSPRITIVGNELERTSGQQRVVTLDLRKNDLTVDGPAETGISFNTSHSMYDAALESQVLGSVTGQQVVAANDVIAAAVAHQTSTLGQRLIVLAGSVHRLLTDDVPNGSTLAIAAPDDPDDSVTLTREGDALAVALGSKAATAARADEDTSWLDGATVRDDRLTDLIRDIETVLANGGGLPIDYVPVYEFRPTQRFYQDLWVFTANPYDPGAPQLSSHYSIDGGGYAIESTTLMADGSTDVSTFTETQTDVEHARQLQEWLPSDDATSNGSLYSMLSHDAYRELKETGTTVLSVVFQDNTVSEPIRFWVDQHASAIKAINGTEVELPTLALIGQYAEPGVTAKPVDDVEPIADPLTGYLVNFPQVIDDPDLPLETNTFQSFLVPAGDTYPDTTSTSTFQSIVAGTVVDAATGLGVNGATVTVSEPGVSAVSWPDGGFSLPAIAQPFASFTVTVEAPGYEPSTSPVDFGAPDALPLSLELTPAAPDQDAVWINAGNVEDVLPDSRLSERSQALIREAVEIDHDVAVLVPGQPTFYALGPIDAWLEANVRTGEFYGMLPDGLYGASTLHDITGSVSGVVKDIIGKGADWAKGKAGEWLDKAIETPYSEEVNGWGSPIAFYGGHVAGWYYFAAGALDTVGIEISKGAISICEFHKRTVATAVLLANGDWRTSAESFGFEQAVSGATGKSLPPGNKAINDIAWKAGVISAIKALALASKIEWGLANTDC